jgi:hypothetical protein
MPIEINADDVARAEAFLEVLLTESIPEGRFTPGTALRDLTVKALAFTFGAIQKDNAQVKALQSLLSVQSIATADPDVDRAVASATDAILSNWFIKRKAGGFARGLVFVEVSKRQDYLISGNHRFSYDRDHVFYPDVTDPSQTIIVKASDLIPVLTVDGTVQGYQFSQRVIAARTGADFNVAPGTWAGGTTFSPFAVRVFSATKFEGGKGRETTTELIARSETATSTRNLINTRSIDATLRDKFTTINRMLVVGMGDPEMQRDMKVELATGSKIHVGGHYDVYLELPRVQAVFEGQVGGSYIRPDGVINVFRDSTISNWNTTGIQLGDVIRISSVYEDSPPKDFVIKEITSTELRVSENTPFAVATDELGDFVDYYIYRPIYGADVQLLPTLSVNTTGQTSRRVQVPNRVVLPGGAHYDILDVAVINPDAGDPYINPTDGYVHFPVRSNETPATVTSQQYLEYQVVSKNTGVAQSQLCFEELYLVAAYNEKTVRVTYETLASLDVIHDFARDRFERVVAGNILTRGYNPVYLSMVVPYRRKPLIQTTINEDAIRQNLTDYINAFDPNDIIDVSDIATFVRNESTAIGAVLPFEINYKLILPDGRTIQFTTEDQVLIDPARINDDLANSSLTNALSLGLSDRTVRYFTSIERIALEER